MNIPLALPCLDFLHPRLPRRICYLEKRPMREDARTLLTREGIVPTESFNPEIRASWQRCFDYGLDPFGYPEQIQISDADLGKRREENGLVRQANQGTLFLDEIGTMPAKVQAKLLRFLDRMEIRPIGNTTEIQLDIQLISATNTVLKGNKRTDEFRPDLLYRINTMEVCLPSLRQRRDLHTIIGAIIETFEHPLALSPEALRLLEAYSWPGNIRELKGLLTRLLISCENSKAGTEDVQKILAVPPVEPEAEQSTKNLADRELEIIQAAYERNSGNISAIARELGISRNTVYKKLKEARLTRLKL